MPNVNDIPLSHRIKLPNGKIGHLRPVARFTVADPDYVAFTTRRLEREPAFRDQVDTFKAEQGRVAQFAGLASFRPTMRSPIPNLGLGTAGQAELVGLRIMPEFIGGPDAQGYYPKYSKEHLYVDPRGSKVGADGTVKFLDVKIEFGTAPTYTHAVATKTEPDEEAAASRILDISINPFKLDKAQSASNTEKENDIATAVTNSANYAATYKETLSGTNQWSHDSSKPLNAFWAIRRKLFTTTLADPDVFAMGGDVEAALQVNPQLMTLASAAKAGTGKSGAPVTRDFLAAVFQIEMAIANAAKVADLSTSTPTHSQVWSDFAGLYCTSPDAAIGPRFGICLGREGYPNVLAYQDDSIGPKGAAVQKFADSWNPVVTQNDAGYLWSDCVA